MADEKPKAAVKKAAAKEPAVSLAGYVRLEHPRIHRYTLAYIEPKYRGILKTVGEWKKELTQYEGKE